MEPEDSLPFTKKSQPSDDFLRQIQSTPSHTASLRHIFMLSSHLRLVFQTAYSLSRFPTKMLYEFISSCVLHVHPHHPWLDEPNEVGKEYKLWSYSLPSQFFHLPVTSSVWSQIFSPELFSTTFHLYSPSQWETQFNTHKKQQVT